MITPFPRSHINIFLISLLVFLVFCIIILSSVPPVSRDALTHHLAIPKLYLQHGGMYEIPDRIASYYPMNLDLLYLLPLYFGNDIVPKLVHFSFALLTAWLIYRYLLAKINRSHALLGVLLFLSTPIVVKLSVTAYVDLGLVFFSTASMLLLLRWHRKPHSIRYFLVAAIACGLALGTKYNGWISFLLLTITVPVMCTRFSGIGWKIQLKAAGWGGLFVLVALLVFSPWMMRNYRWTQNPVYPLYNRFFQSIDARSNPPESTTGEKGSQKGLNSFLTRKLVYGEKWWQTMLIPLRIFFQGKDDRPRFFDGKLNPFLLILPIFTLCMGRVFTSAKEPDKRLFAVFSLLFLLFVFVSTDMRIRYIAPIIPFLAILSVFGLHDIRQLAAAAASPGKKRFWSFSASLVTIGFLALNGMYVSRQFQKIQPLAFITGKITRDTYIEQYRPEYAVIRYANQNLPKKATILAVFIGERGYYFDREVLFDKDRFLLSDRISGPIKPVLPSLKKRGITHLFVRSDLFLRWINTDLNTQEKQGLLFLFQNHVQSVYSKNGYELFKITG